MEIPNSKKLLASALTFVMFMTLASLPLPAKVRKGSMVEVDLSDGSWVAGELLVVKGHELIIHDKSSDLGFSVNIEQIAKIRIKRRSQILSGIAIGFAAGIGLGFIGYAKQHEHYMGTFPILITPIFTMPIGAWAGALLTYPKTFFMNGLNPARIESCLKYLRQHARS